MLSFPRTQYELQETLLIKMLGKKCCYVIDVLSPYDRQGIILESYQATLKFEF